MQLYAGLAARFSGNKCLPLVGNLICCFFKFVFPSMWNLVGVISGCIIELRYLVLFEDLGLKFLLRTVLFYVQSKFFFRKESILRLRD